MEKSTTSLDVLNRKSLICFVKIRIIPHPHIFYASRSYEVQ